MEIGELQQNIEMLAITLNGENYQEQFKKGFRLIVDYKSCGGIQQEAYDTLLVLSKKYREEATGEQFDLICDWLDCICGWIDNKDLHIFNKQYDC